MSKILAPAPDANAAAEQARVASTAPIAQPIPDKYIGKTVEDVIEMHRNAESALGRVNNEVGTLRGLVTDLSQLKRTAEAPVPVVEPMTVSGDDLLADPVAAVRSIVKPELDRLENERRNDVQVSEAERGSQALIRDFGDVGAIVSTEAFQTFASRTAGRQADYQTAASGSGLDQVRAARRLLEDFADFNSSTHPTKEPSNVDRARAVSTEGGHTGAPISTKPQIFEADVIALIQSDPTRYRSPSYQTELLSAIREGRFVKNS